MTRTTYSQYERTYQSIATINTLIILVDSSVTTVTRASDQQPHLRGTAT